LSLKKRKNSKRSQNQKDLSQRIGDIKRKLSSVVQEIEEIKAEGHIAPPSCWMVRYQAKGRGGRYWYYKWMATEAIFINQKGQSSKSKYIGKAGSDAYVQALSSWERRGKIEILERLINLLSQGLEDLVEEATRSKKD
jgi:hypothetical protein